MLQRTAKTLPQLFQAMGLMLYTTQILAARSIFVAVFKNTTLFNPRAFALTLVAATLVWIAAQARAHMKAKILLRRARLREERQARKTGHSS